MEPSELMDLSNKATDRFRHLLLTGITDRESLLAAVQLDMPVGIVLVDASTESTTFILAQEVR